MEPVYPNLVRELHAQGVSVSDLTKVLYLSRSAIYQRLSGKMDWKLAEVVAICQYLEFSDALELFLRFNTN